MAIKMDDENNISYKEQYYNLLEKHSSCGIKIKKAEAELQICLSSASFRLGYLLIHETKSVKDVLKLFSRIKGIRKSKGQVSQPSKKNVDLLSKHKIESTKNSTLNKGISVLIPSYKGESTIYRALSSLLKQDISFELYEIVIVINGEKDGTEQVIKSFRLQHPELNIQLLKLDQSGASLARNTAIQHASYQYTILLDDDDALSATYLSAMYALAAEDTVVLSQIINIDQGDIDSSNGINMQILKANTTVSNAFKSCPGVLTINACKLIPTLCMKQIEYDTSLNSGEDIVYFGELLSKFSLRFKVAKEAIYFRFIEKNSISRQPVSFQFNVVERLKVISGVYRSIDKTTDKEIRYFLEQKIIAQISFINAYLQTSPEDYSKVLDEIKKYQLDRLPIDRLYK
jgi:glycosyltransferase involved in cell wall biosynthesis